MPGGDYVGFATLCAPLWSGGEVPRGMNGYVIDTVIKKDLSMAITYARGVLDCGADCKEENNVVPHIILIPRLTLESLTLAA